MKKIQFLLLFSTLITFSAYAQKEVKTISIHVDGVCDMCKERIENALDVNGVKYAKWDKQSHDCEIMYRTDKITEEELHSLLNQAGHDTDKSRASDSAYEAVHDCCKYRELSKQSEHSDHTGHSDQE
ncbi:MAG TPA: metal transporter [Flavobacteriales bacterium]|nr:metal transporter [Flavobacteriales bacterium]